MLPPLLVLALLAAQPAGPDATPAPEREPTRRSRRLAVLDVQAVGTFDEKTASGFSSLVASEAAHTPLKVLAGKDVAALVSLEQQRQMLTGGDEQALAKVGTALGADFVLRTEVAEVPGACLLTLSVLDVGRTLQVSRLTRRLDRRSQLVDAIPDAVQEVLRPLVSPAAKDVALREQAPQPQRPAPVAGYVLDGVGVAVLAAGLGLGVTARSQFDEARKHRYDPTPTAYDDARSQASNLALAADVCYGVGAVALGVGLVLTILGHTGSDAPVAVTAGPGGVAVAGRF